MRTRIVPVIAVIVLSLTIAATVNYAGAQQAPKAPEDRGLHGFVCGPEGKSGHKGQGHPRTPVYS
jgi:hypothetical protein